MQFHRLEQWFSTFFMQRPILQPNLNQQHLTKISSQAYEMLLCLHKRKSQWLKIAYDITMLNKDSFI